MRWRKERVQGTAYGHGIILHQFMMHGSYSTKLHLSDLQVPSRLGKALLHLLPLLLLLLLLLHLIIEQCEAA
jgi:hypothetical protein